MNVCINLPKHMHVIIGSTCFGYIPFHSEVVCQQQFFSEMPDFIGCEILQHVSEDLGSCDNTKYKKLHMKKTWRTACFAQWSDKTKFL